MVFSKPVFSDTFFAKVGNATLKHAVFDPKVGNRCQAESNFTRIIATVGIEGGPKWAHLYLNVR